MNMLSAVLGILIFAYLAPLHTLKAQTDQEPERVFTVVEQLPEYPGGQQAMMNFIAQNVRYPSQAIRAGIQGRVFVSFKIDKEGNLSETKIEKGIGAGCDEEAARVVSMLTGWSPARQGGKPVVYRYVLPVKFTLNDSPPPVDLSTPAEYIKGEPVMRKVDQLPQYKGGDEALASALAKKLKQPKAPAADARTGVVFTSFIIDRKGNTSGHRIESSLGPAFDTEALRLVKSLKHWKPAQVDGKPVAYRYVQQVKFPAPASKL